MDSVGTVIVTLALFCSIQVARLGIEAEERSRSLYVSLYGKDGVPLLTRVIQGIQKFHGIEALTLVLLLTGIWMLAAVKDRLRANLYGFLAGAAITGVGLVGLSSRLLAVVEVVWHRR